MQLLALKKKTVLRFNKKLLTNKELNDIYNWWITKLIEIYSSYQKALIDFDDASFCLSYLFRYLYNFSGLEFKAVSAALFLDYNKEDWDFVEVYRVCFNKKEY